MFRSCGLNQVEDEDDELNDNSEGRKSTTTLAEKALTWLEEHQRSAGAPKFSAKELRDSIDHIEKIADQLKIDTSNRAQLFAARHFLLACLTISFRFGYYENRIDQINTLYVKKMAQVHKEALPKPASISEINLLLILNDPVEKLAKPKAESSNLELVLANTYFFKPQTFGDPLSYNRNEHRSLIKNTIVELQTHPQIGHIIDALGALMRKEKGRIIILPYLHNAYPTAMRYFGPSVPKDTRGFYNEKHTVFCTPLYNITEEGRFKENRLAVGVLIHESVHMLFYRALNQRSSPVNEADPYAVAELDDVLAKDREHRAAMKSDDLNSTELMTWQTIVEHLEKNSGYFNGGFDPANEQHARTMRAEATVRPAEALAHGATEADVIKIMPHLWAFYQKTAPQLFAKAFS